MSKPTKPQLFYNGAWSWDDIKLPVMVQPKFDGCFVMKQRGTAYTRQGKKIPNKYVRAYMSTMPNGINGEFIVPNATFYETDSVFMSHDKQPPEGSLVVVFDDMENVRDVNFKLKSYHDRYIRLVDCVKTHEITLAPTIWMEDPSQIDGIIEEFEKTIGVGYTLEGAMLRNPDAPYKNGRTTLTENYGYKYIIYKYGRGKCVGFTDNTSKLGHVGSIQVSAEGFETFSIGTGFDIETSKHMHANPDSFIGKELTFKYKGKAVNKPRQPVLTSWV